MGSFKLTYNHLRRWFKPRIIIIPLMILTILLVIPLFIPYDADFNPIYSIYSDDEMGKSRMTETLKDQYNITQEYDDITTRSYDQNTALVIVSPQVEFSFEERNHIVDLVYDQFIPVILIGNNEIMVNLARQFQIEIAPADDSSRVFDFTNNYNNEPGYPLVNDPVSSGEIVSVTPSFIQSSHSITDTTLNTYNTAEHAGCIQNTPDAYKTQCQQEFPIGQVGSQIPYAVYADDFVLSNLIVDQVPSNVNLIQSILDLMGVEVDNLVFDESHYEWYPLNRHGTLKFIEQQLKVPLFVIIILVIIIFVPSIIAYNGGIFEKEFRSENKIGKSIEARLDYMHLERIPAAPLSIEEKILVDERIEQTDRGKYYFQYVAHELRKYIENNDIMDQFSQEEQFYLKVLENSLISNTDSWKIIKLLNQRINNIVLDGGNSL